MLDWLDRVPPEVLLIPPVAIIAFLVTIGLMRHRARLRRYRAIAARTGLSVKPGIVNPSQVHGIYRGRTLAMMTTSPRPTWFSWRRTWTMVTVHVQNPALVGMRIRRKDLFDRLMRLDTIKSDDRDFDRRFLVLSQDKGAVIRILSDASVRRGLMQANVNSVRMYGSTLQVFRGIDERDPEHAAQFFDASVCLADAIDAIRYP
jgi:hypothetical protein